jgi:hypothetical protein
LAPLTCLGIYEAWPPSPPSVDMGAVVDAAGAGADPDAVVGVLFAGADFEAGEPAVSTAVAGVEELVSPGCAPSSLEAQQLSPNNPPSDSRNIIRG